MHMLRFQISLLILIALSANNSHGADILFMHCFASYSHRVSQQPLANALAARGHNVTYISPIKYSKSNPKILDIVPKSYEDFILAALGADFNIENRVEGTMPLMFSMFDGVHSVSCHSLFSSMEFREWMAASPKVDLIVVDHHAACASALAYKLNAKVIIYNTVAFYGKHLDSLGLPEESLVSQADLYYKPEMNFFQRIKNTLSPLGWLYFESRVTESFQSMVKEQLNLTVPTIAEMVREKVDLVLMSGNYITEQPRALPPMFVSVPGLHIEEDVKPLSKDLETFLNAPAKGKSNDGFIYISLGTVVIAPNLPQYVLNSFFGAIRAFPNIKFLWKWDGKIPEGVPENLHMVKWFQQQDVFNHPKIKGFITQAGRPSIQEALNKAIPMILFPVLGDQDFNAGRMEYLGSGIVLEIGEITKDELQGAINRILNDQELISNVKRNSILFNDLPMKPMDTAIWWVEYAIRHKNLDHLKPLARNQTWYERRLLDVWFTLFTLALFFILICSIIIYGIIKQVFKFTSPVPKKSKQS